VLRDGRVVAADADRDKVFVVDLGTREVVTYALEANDEPGRVIEDAEGRVHVVLRRGGKVATIDLVRKVVSRRAVCPAPRGIALETGQKRALVACEGGELVALPVDPEATPNEASLLARLDRDLRDVVVTPSRIFVSRLRSADVIELTPQLATVGRSKPASPRGQRTMQAMRMVAAPPGDPLGEPILVHEIARDPGRVSGTSTAPYYQGPATRPEMNGTECVAGSGPIVLTAVSRPGLDPRTARAPDLAAFPVDIAADAATIAIVAAGNGHTKSLPQVYTLDTRTASSSGSAALPCLPGARAHTVAGQAVAVAFRRPNALVVQSREPATLELLPEHVIIPLSSESREDTGHALFHSSSGSGVACASCHPEGGDDGQVWTLDQNGPMRTTSLRGTLRDTAPFHWRGDLPDFSTLTERVMTGRMNGPSLDPDQTGALEAWLYALPGPNSAPRSAAAERGRALFESEEVGCASCHSGPRFTSAGTLEIGSGGAVQIPSLVGVATHAPYFHTGCAPSLEHLGLCGGKVHQTSLDAARAADLVAYLETL